MAGGLDRFPDRAEKAGELAEDQRPVAAAHHVGDVLDERLDLGGRDVPVRLVDQAGMQAQLAQ